MNEPEPIFIKSAKDARRCIGQVVYWDDKQSYAFRDRSGVLEKVEGYNLFIGNEYRWRPDLTNLRNFPNMPEKPL